MNPWRKVRFGAVLFLCLFVAVYPLISNAVYCKHSSRLITVYEEAVAGREEAAFDAERSACQAYNAILASQVISSGADPVEALRDYDSRLNVEGSGMMGYVTIPKLALSLPVYHGTGDAVLEIGLGHMRGTSLPVGGESSHAVITGHTGLSEKRMFSDLEAVEVGDRFAIKVLNSTLTYEVDQIQTVLPTDLEALKIVEGKDYVTLVTCTPYGVNSHRLLVRGVRVKAFPTVMEEDTEVAYQGASPWLNQYIFSVGLGLASFALILLGNLFRQALRPPESRKGGAAVCEFSAGRPRRKAAGWERQKKNRG